MLKHKTSHEATTNPIAIDIQAYSHGVKVFYRTIFLVVLIMSLVVGGLILMLKA